MSDDHQQHPHEPSAAGAPGAGDAPGPDAPGPDAPGPDVGSVAEEAMKLFGAFSDLARQHGADLGGGVAGLGEQAAEFGRQINDHLATGSEDCRYCPVCKVVHVVRQTSPEVRTHLMVAASSLLQAAAGLLETLPDSPPESNRARGAGVQKIDLDPDDPGHHAPEPDGTW